jgi:hypothetical protein
VSKDLTPEKALIFRIVHRGNVPWILDKGLYCKNSKVLDPNYVEIGNLDLITKRRNIGTGRQCRAHIIGALVIGRQIAAEHRASRRTATIRHA